MVVALATPVLILAVDGVASAALRQGRVFVEDTDEPVIVLTGWLDVPEDATVDDAIIFDGNATIGGHVTGTVLAFHGDILVSGTVDGDVVSISGRVTLDEGAVVDGSITSQLRPQIASTATVGGTISQNQFNVDVLLVGRIAFWLAASVASLLFGLLLILFAPRAAEATAATARGRVGASIGFGLLLFLGIPVVGGIALVTIVGALFGVAVLTGMVMLYLVAYAGGALSLGRLLLRSPRKAALAFLLAWVILRVMALVPVLGGFLFAAVAIWGFGALAVAAFSAGRDRRQEPTAAGSTGQPELTTTSAPPMPPAP